MSQLLGNIHSIIGAFNKYAKDDGECATLSKGELKSLIQKEFAEVIVNPQDPETIETMLQLLDKDCDGKVDFEEFTVLVFKVAKACYKKEHECGVTAEGQSRRGGSSARRQETSVLSKGSTQQPAQEPEKVSEPESQCSSQEEKQESPKSETLSDRRSKEPLKQERGSRFSQKPSWTCPAQREREEGQRGEKEPSCQGFRREVQHCSKPSQRKPQIVAEEISRQSCQEPDTPDECQTQGTQQSTVQKPSQPCQMEEQGHREPQEQEQAAQQPTPHRKEAPRQTQEPLKREQDVVKPKSQESQKAVRRPAQRGVEEPQAPEQKSTSQSCRDHQEEQPSLGCGKERTSTSEQHSTYCQEQEPQRGERSMQQQECKPQTRGKGAVRRLVEEYQEAKDDSCQQPTKEVQEPEQAQSCKPDGGILTRGKQSTHQQECQSQGHEQALTGQEEQESQSPEEATTGCHERQPLTTVRHQPHQDIQEPQHSGKSHYRRHECQTLTPEQVVSPQEDTKPQPSEKEACSEPTESTEQTTTGCHEGQRLTRRQHEPYPEERKPQNTRQSQYRSHECSPLTPEEGPFPQERTTSQKQEREEAEGSEKATTACCECPSLRRRQPCPEESKPQKPGQSQHRSHACQPWTPKQVPSAQEMSQTQEREASCELPEAPEKATSRGRPSEQCQPHVEEQKPKKPGQSQRRCQESQPLVQEQALSPKEETKPQVSKREASCESVETPEKATSGGRTCQPSPSERCQSRSEEQKPQRPRQSQHHCQASRPLTQEQALSPKEETKPQVSKREASCESVETPRKATSGGHACQSSTSEQSQTCPEERKPQKPRQSKDQHECQSSETERGISPQEETNPCEQEQESSSQETEAPERATTGRWKGQSSSTRHQPHSEEGKPQNSGQIQYCPHECRPLTPEQATSPQEETKPQTSEREGSCEPTQSPASQGPIDSLARQPLRPWPQQQRRALQFPSPWSPKH
ncbi:cornulin-like [Podarcis lilfordi]|uniref:Cornulin-like n=1 Tax=Podarcis lilfordi TaxID=74358 RepID=A0AA35LMK1_9SAUR|nr:cornulin-like [Podarcis lilfordi]